MTDALSGERLGHRIRIDDDGMVTVLTGKVELGQGVHAAFARIVADELDVPIDRVRVAPVDTRSSPDEGLTAGSRSIEQSGALLQRIAAEVRHALVAEAADRLRTTASDLRVTDGVIASPSGETIAFGALAGDGRLLDRSATGDVDPKPAGARRFIGTSVARRDLHAKVTGQPAFVHDIDLPGMLHGRIVRPPDYHAQLVEVDFEEIEAMPGVVRVVRDGRFLGVVAAREEQAIAARRRAQRVTDWAPGAPLPATADPRYLLGADSEEIVVVDRASPEPGAAPVRTLRAEYTREHLAHASVGPSCAVARCDEGRYEVWTHSQGVFRLRYELALVLGVPEDDVRVIHAEGAGCYGHNGADDVALDAALLARSVPGRPVRVQWMRDDEFGWEPYGPAMVVRMAADLGADGRIASWTHELWGHGHETRPWQGGRPPDEVSLLAARHLGEPFTAPLPRRPRGPSSGGQRNATPPYDLPSLRVVDHYVPDAPLRVSSLRALGAHANVFASESFMDELAAAAASDPVEFRLLHLSDPRARAVVEAAATLAGWRRGETGDGEHGRGIGFAQYKNASAYAAVVVEVELDTEIRVRRAWGAIDAGMIVDPDGLSNQAEGGIVQAVSWALHEAVRTDGPGIATLGWDTYRTLRFPDAPSVEVALIDRPDLPPLGAGEAFAGPTAAAIANAVHHASGLRIRDLPMTRERVIAAIG